MTDIVYLNAAFMPASEATISPFDRGFLFADAVYEVVPVYQGYCFMLDAHLARLEKSLAAIDLTLPLKTAEIAEILHQLVKKNDPALKKNLSIYLQISRGADATQRSHTTKNQLTPTIFAMCQPAPANTNHNKTPVTRRAITLDDPRRSDCYIKATGLLPNTLALAKAKEQGADEAIFIRAAEAMEATSSNLFIVHNGQLITPPATRYILHGITRQLVLELAKQLHIPCLEQAIPLTQLGTADEVFITGSSKNIWPITAIDEQVISHGEIGPISAKLIQAYEHYLEQQIKDYQQSK